MRSGSGGTHDAILGLVLVADVEHAHAGIVIGGEDRLLADERAGTVLVAGCAAEVPHLAEIAVRGCRQDRDRQGLVLGSCVDDPGVERSLGAEIGIRLVGDDDDLPLRQRQRRVRAAGLRRRPVDVRQQLRARRIADVVDREPPSRHAHSRGCRTRSCDAARSACLRRRRRLAAGAMHAGQPPPRHDFRLGSRWQDRRCRECDP